MSFTIVIDQKELQSFRRVLNKLGRDVKRSDVTAILKKHAKPIANDIAAMTPVRKGSYRVQHIDRETGKSRKMIIRPDTLQARYRHYRGGWGRGNDLLRGRRKGVKSGSGVIRATTARGNLRKSIVVRTPRKRHRTADHEVWAGRNTDGWYFFMVSYGTKYQQPRNIIRKAEMKHRQRALNGISKDVKKFIDKKSKKYGL